jgi:hypothetical protein
MNGLIGMLRSIDCEYSVHQRPSWLCPAAFLLNRRNLGRDPR